MPDIRKPDPSDAARRSPGRSSVHTVVIVDDDAAYLRMARRVLTQTGIECHIASNAHDALRLIAGDDTVDVVITDIVMPEVDGMSLASEIRRQFSARPWLQIILVTGNASLDSALDAFRHSVVSYLLKPTMPKDLVNAVQAALQQAEEGKVAAMLVGSTPDAANLSRLVATARELIGVTESSAPSKGQDKMIRRWFEANKSGETAPHMLKTLLKLMNIRSDIFKDLELDEPAWLILLELAHAALEGRPVAVTSLCLASRSPTTTALRRIEDLRLAGLVDRVPDPMDKRRTHIELTPAGLEKMQKFIRSVASTSKSMTASKAGLDRRKT